MYPNIFGTKWTVKNVFPLYRYVNIHTCVCIHTQLTNFKAKNCISLKKKKSNLQASPLDCCYEKAHNTVFSVSLILVPYSSFKSAE